MKNEVMTKEELHEYGVNLIVSYLNKNDYTIMETNTALDTTPQIIAQKGAELYFILVDTCMFPKKNAKVDKETIEILRNSAEDYGAKCYVAHVGLAYADANTKKELGMPYKNADFLVKFKGLEEI